MDFILFIEADERNEKQAMEEVKKMMEALVGWLVGWLVGFGLPLNGPKTSRESVEMWLSVKHKWEDMGTTLFPF